jgi:amphi-Trp domain-containing protein
MSSSSERFKHESLEDNESIVKYLEALRDGFAKGALLLSTDNRKLLAQPRGLINLDVEAKKKDDEIKLTLKFRWVEESTHTDVGTKPLNIQAIDRT